MLETWQGIVLRTVKYSDTAFIADLYTRQLGRRSVMVSVPRSRKSVVKGVLFQPLASLEVQVVVRPHTSIYKVKESKSVMPLVSLPCDPYKMSIALFMAEFLSHAVHEEDNPAPLYDYLHSAIEWLDACRGQFANFHLVFLMRLSRFLGLLPNLDDYTPGCYFDLLNACFITTKPTDHTYYIKEAEAAALHQLMRMNFDTMHLFKMNRAQRMRCLEVMVAYYQLHLPAFAELKSLDVLRELFD